MSEPSMQHQTGTTQVTGHPASPPESDLRRVAIGRLRRRRSFRSHLFVYVTVNALLWTAWIVGGLLDAWVFPWPIFPTVFWGLFVLGWARDLYGKDPIGEEQIQREIDQLRHASDRRPPDGFDPRDRPFLEWPHWPFDDSHERHRS